SSCTDLHGVSRRSAGAADFAIRFADNQARVVPRISFRYRPARPRGNTIRGASMKLVAIPSQTVGPYFHLGLTGQRSVGCVASPGPQGEPVKLIFTVLDGDGQPINDAMIEIWQANADGQYNHSED